MLTTKAYFIGSINYAFLITSEFRELLVKNELFEENQNTIVSGTFVELRQNFGNFL